MGWITQALRVLAESLGLVNKRTELKNAADVRDRAKAQDEANAVAATATAVAKGNVDELRKELSE